MHSIRHHMRQSWELFTTNPVELALTTRQCQRSKPITFRMMPNALRERLLSKLSISVELSEPIKSVESFLYNHIEFISGRYYVIRLKEEEDSPIFGCVKFMIFFRRSWFYAVNFTNQITSTSMSMLISECRRLEFFMSSRRFRSFCT